MRTYLPTCVLLSLVVAPARAQTTPAPVPIVEPGKPMRFQAVAPAPAPAAAAAPGVEPCDLEMPQDRRMTSSTTCMRCHDGSKAANASFGHRFDIDYVVQGKELRPNPEQYNPAVVLGGGKVTCMSCHVPLSTAPMRLAAPTGGALEQRLCTACHIR
ncbi:MAG TPA: hypothetical protein VFM45_10805 [Anaeromyxobacteraceae bacterium]|nr:hypothetical protein [Anaeromyxobacteraceae bacterium]